MTNHHRRTLSAAAVAVVASIALAACGTGPSLAISGVSTLTAGSSSVSIDFSVTNNGTATVRPKCTITVTDHAGKTSKTTRLSPVKPTDIDMALNELVPVAGHAASAITARDVAVSCVAV